MKLCEECNVTPIAENRKKFCSQECADDRHRMHRQERSTQYIDPEQWAKYIRAKRYGMTVDELEAFVDLHKGLCHICQTRKVTCIDHDHITGKVRGMLCNRCNTALGAFGDNEEGVLRALEYLRRLSVVIP